MVGEMNKNNLNKFITEALAIEAQEAAEAGTLGYMTRALTQATMPHRQAAGNEFTRTNGLFSLSMLAPSSVGLPYGSIPRLLVSWITTESVRTRSLELELGPTLSGFMMELGFIPTGGKWGTITRLRDQMKRLFSSSITCLYEDDYKAGIVNVTMVNKARLWWDPKSSDQAPFWKSTITLGQEFFEEAIRSPIPVDLRALKALKRSPMALDIYCWLTHRMFYLKKPTEIPWPALQMQFGADYAQTRQFKAAFLHHLRKVLVVYPQAHIEEAPHGLMLKPGKPHILLSQP